MDQYQKVGIHLYIGVKPPTHPNPTPKLQNRFGCGLKFGLWKVQASRNSTPPRFPPFAKMESGSALSWSLAAEEVTSHAGGRATNVLEGKPFFLAFAWLVGLLLVWSWLSAQASNRVQRENSENKKKNNKTINQQTKTKQEQKNAKAKHCLKVHSENKRESPKSQRVSDNFLNWKMTCVALGAVKFPTTSTSANLCEPIHTHMGASLEETCAYS